MISKSKGVRLVWLRRVIRAIVVLTLLWLCLSPRVLPGLYTHRLFHPDKDNGTAQDVSNLAHFSAVSNRSIDFVARDGSRLRGWIFSANQSNTPSGKVFLVCPGNAGDIPKRLEFIQLLLSTGASVFTYEPRGFGKSEGRPTIAHICEDGETAYDYLTGVLGYKANQIFIYGISLGTTVATHLSSVRPTRALILQSGFASLPRIAREHVPFLKIYPNLLFPHSPSLNNAEILEENRLPLLIMHGGKDNIIDASHSEEMFRRAVGAKQFVLCPSSTHVNIDPVDSSLFKSTLVKFLAQQK